jgi:general secretion pathway protein J
MKKVLGFTLLELMVVMALLSLLMTGLISALRTMAQTETKIDQRLDRLDALRTTHAFLSKALGGISVARIDMPGELGKTMIPFSATAESLTWVGILSARPDVGGRRYFRLAIESQDDGDALVLRLAPCDADYAQPDWSVGEFHILTRRVGKLTIEAQGQSPQGHEKEKTWPSGWQTGWPIADVAPEQLRLSLQGDSQTGLAQWTFAIHGLPQSDESINTP